MTAIMAHAEGTRGSDLRNLLTGEIRRGAR